MPIEGFFSLRKTRDLLEKMEFDLDRWRAHTAVDREAHYAAFDFFVDANHMADWASEEFGGGLPAHRHYTHAKLVEHIAVGAKHFVVRDKKRHKTASGGGVTSGGFQTNGFDNSAFSTWRIYIELEGGGRVDALEVADQVLEHWRKFIGP